MLHEDNPEVRSYFLPEQEVMLFNSESDLLLKLDNLLRNNSLRESIKLAGYQRCINEAYDYSTAAKSIIRKYEMGIA
jgi:spore maturation protein CgeB